MKKVEVFVSPTCSFCPMAVEIIKRIEEDVDIDVEYLDIIESRTRALEYGLMAVPAIAIDGKIKFVGVPEEEELRKELE